jgi:hypothetical protein
MNGHLPVVEALLSFGGNITKVTESCTQPHFSFETEDFEQQEDVEDAVVHEGAFGESKISAMSGDTGAEDDEAVMAGDHLNSRFTPVALACCRGHAEIVERLLKTDIVATGRTFGKPETRGRFFVELRNCVNLVEANTSEAGKSQTLKKIQQAEDQWQREERTARRDSTPKNGDGKAPETDEVDLVRDLISTSTSRRPEGRRAKKMVL